VPVRPRARALGNSIYMRGRLIVVPCLGGLIVLTPVPEQIGCMHGLITFAHNDEIAGP